MSATKGGRPHDTYARSYVQPRLVHLIAGLRQHQVEEAMQILLDYIDHRAPAAPSAEGDLMVAQAIPGVRGPRPYHHQRAAPEIMPLTLCEAKTLVLRPGQPYVFLPVLDCDSCKADLAKAVEAYGSDAVKAWLIASRDLVKESWPCQTGVFA